MTGSHRMPSVASRGVATGPHRGVQGEDAFSKRQVSARGKLRVQERKDQRLAKRVVKHDVRS